MTVPSPAPAETASEVVEGEAFSQRVLIFFGTQVVTAGLVLFNGFFVARLIGPSGKGDYYLLTFLPPTLMVLSQLGLPQAFTFFAARGRMHGLIQRSMVLTAVIALPILLVAVLLLPFLQGTLMHGLNALVIVLPLLSLPFLLNANFTTGIVVGRQFALGMAVIYISVAVASTLLLLVLVGVLGQGLWGALVAFTITGVATAGGFLFGARMVGRHLPSRPAVSYRELLGYGIPYYPGTLSRFFATRVDVYLLAWLLAAPSAPLGYYSMAVAMAEVVFLFPNAVSTFFFPHVAGTTREESDRQVATVSRVTLLLTGGVALLIVPIAAIAIPLLLPGFEPALPALYILLPGVVAIAVTQVLSGYVAGLGRPATASIVSVAALIFNVVLNLMLIPSFGILGASTASLISYTASSVVYSILAARITGQHASAFWIPRASDVRFAISSGMGVLRWLRAASSPGSRAR